SIDNIVQIIVKSLLNEVKINFIFIAQVFLLVILSAVIKNLADSFNNKEAAEIAYYICYVLIIISIIKS
ncbi:MAG TPA: hypothetical protein DEG71_02900, partial [Clostridiales bacterium]|nr:hypothetical protein [Clostridiales bacterium]